MSGRATALAIGLSMLAHGAILALLADVEPPPPPPGRVSMRVISPKKVVVRAPPRESAIDARPVRRAVPGRSTPRGPPGRRANGDRVVAPGPVAKARRRASGPAVASADRAPASNGGAVTSRGPGVAAPVDLTLRARPGAPAVVISPERDEGGPQLRARSGGRLEVEDTRVRVHIEHDGQIRFEDRPPPPLTFDLTELAMRIAGEDPNLYEKAKIMRQTGALRATMADAACRERLGQSVLSMRAHLDAIWSDDTRPVAERRRQIFELWDECAEAGSPEVVVASALVRATIYGFVRDHLPAGSPLAYRRGEIHALNRRRASDARFSPYARTSTAGTSTRAR